MYSIQVDGTLHQFMQIFYQIGIWQSDEEPSYRKIGKKLFYTFFSALYPLFFLINTFLTDDRNEFIYSVEATILTSVVYVKVLYLIYKKKEILEFFNDPIVTHSIENGEDYAETNKKIRKFMKFVRAYCFALFISAVLLIVARLPIFTTDDNSLPVFISLTWNDSEIVYWLVYLLVSVSIILYSIINMIIALISYIMLNYSFEYQLLGNRLKALGMTTRKNQKKQEKHKKIKRKAQNQKKTTLNSVPPANKFVENLIVLVKAHRNLNETVERFRSCFSTLFMAQIATSGIVICVSVYMLAYVSSENIFQILLFVCCILYGTFDIFLVMYFANEITVASDRLSYCLFESNWIEQTESCKKYVLIMGEVLKRPRQLVILLYPMNLETFVKVVNGAYSMFNILKSF